MIIKTFARSTTRIMSSPTAIGMVPPAFVSELVSNSDVNIGVMSLSTIASTLIDAAPDSISEVQTFGEQTFLAAFLIAAAQAVVAVFQYQTNPSGQLVVPPGPTHGTAMPLSPSKEEENKPTWFDSLKELESNFRVSCQQAKNGEDCGASSPSKQYAATMRRISRSLVFLLPWATNVFAFILERNVHLFHLGFIFALAQLFDVPNRLFPMFKKHKMEPTLLADDTLKAIDLPTKTPERILVLGDSLVAGVGSVNVYEEDQEGLGEEHSIENGPGPVFPRVLAQTLSQRTGQPVHWRSEGVVGGDTGDIEEMCLFALQEEVDKGQAPDVVVVVSGINDLKHFASNPAKYPGPQAFRNRLVSVIEKIQEISPESKVVLPALPTQMFRRDSPLNIFPLVGFVSAIVGFWDAQKKYVAHRYPDSNVEYIGLSPSEIYQWYMNDDSTKDFGLAADEEDDEEDIGLISADGIHPNARCYAHWAASLAKKLVDVEEVNSVNLPLVTEEGVLAGLVHS